MVISRFVRLTVQRQLGIASAGLILYALVPPAVVARQYLTGAEAISFLGGMKYAYLFGGLLSVVAALFSFMQGRGRE